MTKETRAGKNKRRLALYGEIGGLIGPILERETSIDLARSLDCIDCLFTHATEILSIYYGLSVKDASDCYVIMRKDIQAKIKEIHKTKSEDTVITNAQ